MYLANLIALTSALSGVMLAVPPPVKVASAVAASSTTTTAVVYPTPAYDGGYLNTVLEHHNVHRANHSAAALEWAPLMAEWATVLAERSIGTKPYGQNIAAGTPPNNISLVISNEFYNAEVNSFDGLYGQANPSMTNFAHWGHFSQVVWKGSTNVGCATVNCASKGGIAGLDGLAVEPWMTVCNYWPPGNYLGEFGVNVGSPLGYPTVTGYY